MITRLTSPTALRPVGQEQGYVHCKVVGNVSIAQFLRHKFKKLFWRPVSIYWHFLFFLHFKLFW